MKENWHMSTKRQAVATLFCDPALRNNNDAHGNPVDVVDVLPPILLEIGRRVMEAQHFFNIRDDAAPSISAWSQCTPLLATVAGCLNLFVLGLLIRVLLPEMARKLHPHVATWHMIVQAFTSIQCNKTAQRHEKHFGDLRALGSVNKNNALDEVAWYLFQHFSHHACHCAIEIMHT
jgi:hypothetical protein